MPAHVSSEGTGGFSLVEVLVAVVVLAVLAGGLALLPVLATRALTKARVETSAVFAAQARLEQLSALAWGFGSAHAPAPQTDRVTNLSSREPSSGGTGLGPSPPGTLDADTDGFVDYLDGSGRWVARGAIAPGGARLVRRWNVHHIAAVPASIVIRVRVIDRRGEIGDVRLATFRTRTAG